MVDFLGYVFARTLATAPLLVVAAFVRGSDFGAFLVACAFALVFWSGVGLVGLALATGISLARRLRTRLQRSARPSGAFPAPGESAGSPTRP